MREEIKILIIEDEEIWSKSIASELINFGYTVAGIADRFEQAIILFNSIDFDLVLLDINLNNKNSGIELGKMLSNLYKKPFIFITGSEHQQNEAIEVHPSAYLTKPFNATSLLIAIQNAINSFYNRPSQYASNNVSEEARFFFVKTGNKYIKIDWKDIAYMRSDKNYTHLYNVTDSREYSIRCTLLKTLKHFVPPVMQCEFVQVNRREAVQIFFIKEIVDDEVRTVFGKFALTESYNKALKNYVRIIS